MKSPAEILRQLVIDLDSDEWSSFVSFLPDEPNEALCFYDTAGKLDGRVMSTGEQVEHPGVQIRVRGMSYAETWNKANSIVKILDVVKKVSVVFPESETYIVHNVSRSGAVIPLGIDETGNRRLHHFTANMTVTISRDEEP